MNDLAISDYECESFDDINFSVTPFVDNTILRI